MKYRITVDKEFWPLRYQEWHTLTDEQQRHRMETTMQDWNERAKDPSALLVVAEEFAQYVHVKRLLYSPGVHAIEIERIEQVEKHGHDAAHDDQYQGGELEDAAKALLNEDYEQWPKGWPAHDFLRMSEKGTRERLAVVGAFLAAEIDRIDRQLAAQQGSEKLAQA